MDEVIAYLRYQTKDGKWINVGLAIPENYLQEVWPMFQKLVTENNNSKNNKEDI